MFMQLGDGARQIFIQISEVQKICLTLETGAVHKDVQFEFQAYEFILAFSLQYVEIFDTYGHWSNGFRVSNEVCTIAFQEI